MTFRKPFETAEEALSWAVEFSNRRYIPKASGRCEFGSARQFEIVDVFNSFAYAYLNKMITKEQYVMFLYAKRHNNIPPMQESYHLWDLMMNIISPILIEKGIIIKTKV